MVQISWQSFLISLSLFVPLAITSGNGQGAIAQEAPEITLENSVPTPNSQHLNPFTTAATTSPPERETQETETKPPENSQENPSENPETTSEEEEKNPGLELTPEEQSRNQKLIEADRLFLEGNQEAATAIYRQVKPPLGLETNLQDVPDAYSDPAQLPPAGAVYWRQHQEGLESNLYSKIFVPAELLVTQFPEFIPGHLSYAAALQKIGHLDDALTVLERVTAKYPNEPDLVYTTIQAETQNEKWLEASLMARQFAILNPDSPRAPEFLKLAEDNLAQYQRDLRGKITGNAIAGFLTGALGFILTGNIFGPISAVETGILLLQGESAVGDRIANRIIDRIPLVEDEEVLNYVREIGNKIVQFAGRNEFDYQFNVIMDEDLNAFALPGGKVFINAGAIAKTNSEAELAGLLAHEISHAVLSHGFQLITEGQVTANVVGNIPYIGGLATNLIVFGYSREMERQADILGTRLLVSSGYAADGVRNLMATLDTENKPGPPAWLSTHPETQERISYLDSFILANDYNRYTYEGVEHHTQIRDRVLRLLGDFKNTEEYQEMQRRRRDW